jgi:hypothetical protein
VAGILRTCDFDMEAAINAENRLEDSASDRGFYAYRKLGECGS